MTWLPIVMKFVSKYWRSLAVAVLAAALIAGVASLWGRLEVAQGRVAKLTAELEAANVQLETSTKQLATCVKANEAWLKSYDDYLKGQAKLNQRLAQYRANLEAELLRRQEAAATIDDLNAKLASQVTAEECPAAVGQLIAALGWGGGDQ